MLRAQRIYRTRPQEGRWHFCPNCREWPTVEGTYKKRTGLAPQSWECCNECNRLLKEGTCAPPPESGA